MTALNITVAPSSVTVEQVNNSVSVTYGISGGGVGLPIEISDVTGLQTALDGKSATSHTHTIANVTNLQTSLDAKMATATYDPNTVADDAFSMDNMLETADAKVMTAAERDKLAFVTQLSATSVQVSVSGGGKMTVNSTGVGFGTDTPTAAFSFVYTSTSHPDFTRYATDTVALAVNVRKARGTEASPTATSSGDAIGSFYAQARSDLGTWLSAGIINFKQTSAWSSGAANFQMVFSLRRGASGFVEQLDLDGVTAEFSVPTKVTPVTVANLPAAGTVGAGARHFVTDANATTFASIVAGGGANGVPVYSDGTNWRIG